MSQLASQGGRVYPLPRVSLVALSLLLLSHHHVCPVPVQDENTRYVDIGPVNKVRLSCTAGYWVAQPANCLPAAKLR